MTYLGKLKQLKGLLKRYNDFFVSENLNFKNVERNALIREMNAVCIRINDIDNMPYNLVKKECCHSEVQYPSIMNIKLEKCPKCNKNTLKKNKQKPINANNSYTCIYCKNTFFD